MNPTSPNCKTLVSKLQKATADYIASEKDENPNTQTLEAIVPILQVYQELFLTEINFALDNNLHVELWKTVVKAQVGKLEDLSKNKPNQPINTGEIQKIIHVIQGYYSSTIEILNQRLNPHNESSISFVNELHNQGCH